MAETAEERRRHFRFPVRPSVPCLVRVEGSGKTAPLAGRLRNISVSGALLELATRLPHGSIVAVGASTVTGSIDVEGEVIWVTAGGDAGGGPIHVHGVQFAVPEGGPDPALEDLLRSFAEIP